MLECVARWGVSDLWVAQTSGLSKSASAQSFFAMWAIEHIHLASAQSHFPYTSCPLVGGSTMFHMHFVFQPIWDHPTSFAGHLAGASAEFLWRDPLGSLEGAPSDPACDWSHAVQIEAWAWVAIEGLQNKWVLVTISPPEYDILPQKPWFCIGSYMSYSHIVEFLYLCIYIYTHTVYTF